MNERQKVNRDARHDTNSSCTSDTKGLQRLYERNDLRSLHAANVPRICRILYMLRSARQPSDMDQPGFRLHPLRGEYQGHWSVAVSGNWRIVFRFEAGEAMDINLVD